MRKSLLVGLGLVVASVLVVLLSAWFDLELESVALLGVAVGAILAVVPDGSPVLRLVGCGAGIVTAWVAYLLRAGVLPDSVGGRTAAVVLVLVVCVAVAALSGGRVPLWSTLLGAAALVGAYEHTYDAAPPEVVTTSVTAVTALLLPLALGYLAAVLVSELPERPARAARDDRPRNDDTTGNHSLDEMMEPTP